MSEVPLPPAVVPDRDYEEREKAVLAELARDQASEVSFQGLRRKLGLHQQILSRTLRRLVEDDAVVRTEAGQYRLSPRLRQAVPTDRNAPADFVTLAAAHASDETVAALARDLQGRWFRGLHWYGKTEAPGAIVLTWLTDPGERIVRLRLTPNRAAIEVQGANGATQPAVPASFLATLTDHLSGHAAHRLPSTKGQANT